MSKKKERKKHKISKIPPEAEEEPKILHHSKYGEEPLIEKKSKYEE